MKAAQVLDHLMARTSVGVRIARRREAMAYMTAREAARTNFYWGFVTGLVFSGLLAGLVMVTL